MDLYSIAYSLAGDAPTPTAEPRVSGVFPSAEAAEEHRQCMVKNRGAKNSFVFKEVRPAADLTPITWNEAFETAVPFVQRACEAFRPRQSVFLHFFGNARKEWGDTEGIVKTICDKAIVVETIGPKKVYIWFGSTGIGDRWVSSEHDFPCELYRSQEDFMESMDAQRIKANVQAAIRSRDIIGTASYDLVRDLEQVLYKRNFTDKLNSFTMQTLGQNGCFCAYLQLQ